MQKAQCSELSCTLNFVNRPFFPHFVQIVQTTHLVDPDNPVEIIYFVEGANGQRLPAATTASMLNSLDVQHAAIIMGYRVQGILAQREHSDF